MAYVGAGQSTYSVFPIENYTFGHKAPKLEKQRTLEARFRHLQQRYAEAGMRRTVEGVVLVHAHRALHVLLLQAGPSFFRLPGGRLKAGEDEVAGLARKLTRRLAPERADDLTLRWQVADCVGRFYRPNFEPSMYPYCPPHIERPKECRTLFLVNLPARAFLAVPRNMKLVAVPLFELHEHAAKYGPAIAALPLLLSRLHFTLVSPAAAATPVARPVPPAPDVPLEHAAAQQHQQQQAQQQQQHVQVAASSANGYNSAAHGGFEVGMQPPQPGPQYAHHGPAAPQMY